MTTACSMQQHEWRLSAERERENEKEMSVSPTSRGGDSITWAAPYLFLRPL